MKFANEILTFLFELFALVSMYVFMLTFVDSKLAAIAAATILSALIVLIWASFMAPNASRRLAAVKGMPTSSLVLLVGPVLFLVSVPGVIGIVVAGLFLVVTAAKKTRRGSENFEPIKLQQVQ